MGKTKQLKKPKPSNLNKIHKLKKLKKKTKPASPISDSEPESDPQTTIQTLLEPFTKDQLITLITDLSSSHTSLISSIKSAADKDVSHRKIFVHGLGWDATREIVNSVFSTFGQLEDINVVTDRATGKCKGYAFITYKFRKSATSLLKNPKITVGNRVTSCRLASAGPVSTGAPVTGSEQRFSSNLSDFPLRKIYVNNVRSGVDPGRLRVFFEKFGEIENGPTGLDPNTGKFRGYAIFVFKTVEGARKVLEEPYKLFAGNQLHCQQATEGKNKGVGGNASITTGLQPIQPQMLAAVAAAQQAQSMALLGQQQTGMVNPLYGGGMIPNANLGALMGGYYGMMGGQLQGYGLGAYGVTGSGVGGAGGSTGAMLQGLPGGSSGPMLQGLPGGSSGPMLQGLPGGSSGPMGLQYAYPSTLTGQSPSPFTKTSGTSGNGYPPR